MGGFEVARLIVIIVIVSGVSFVLQALLVLTGFETRVALQLRFVVEHWQRVPFLGSLVLQIEVTVVVAQVLVLGVFHLEVRSNVHVRLQSFVLLGN